MESSQLSGSLHEANSAASARESGGSFLLLASSMFRPMMELLLCRLPPDLKRHAIRRISKFLRTNTLPTMTGEASVLCNAATLADTSLAASEILVPLLGGLADDLPNQSRSPQAQHVSNALQGRLRWRLGLLAAILHRLGPDAVAHSQGIQQVIDRAFKLEDAPLVQKDAAKVLTALISTCVLYYPQDQYSSLSSSVGSSAVEVWFTKLRPSSDAAPTWHIPSQVEVDLALQLVHKYVDESIFSLQSMFATDSAEQNRTTSER
eukprot:scaffold647843_cov52-Prasinocladus_malaysianus.AAC.1